MTATRPAFARRPRTTPSATAVAVNTPVAASIPIDNPRIVSRRPHASATAATSRPSAHMSSLGPWGTPFASAAARIARYRAP